jgi:hypothetical protein
MATSLANSKLCDAAQVLAIHHDRISHTLLNQLNQPATHLNSSRVSVDLPLPVAPTNATVLPPGTLNETCASNNRIRVGALAKKLIKCAPRPTLTTTLLFALSLMNDVSCSCHNMTFYSRSGPT